MEIPNEWTPENPAKGQCDVSSFIAWEYLGGDRVLGKVFINGEQIEHHYWDRIGGEDFDLTLVQFTGTKDIQEFTVVNDDYLRNKPTTMKSEVAAQLDRLRGAVGQQLKPSNARL